jgi:hypothetical protein
MSCCSTTTVLAAHVAAVVQACPRGSDTQRQHAAVVEDLKVMDSECVG